MGVGAGLSMYVVVVQKFTFGISSPDEFLLSTSSSLCPHDKLYYRSLCPIPSFTVNEAYMLHSRDATQLSFFPITARVYRGDYCPIPKQLCYKHYKLQHLFVLCPLQVDRGRFTQLKCCVLSNMYMYCSGKESYIGNLFSDCGVSSMILSVPCTF